MSQAPYVTKAVRWGQKMGNVVMLDGLLEGLSDPFGGFHMGITAENVARKYEVTREAQDALAAEGHKRAAHAIAEGRFKEQILPVEIKTRKGVTIFDTDEHVRAERPSKASPSCGPPSTRKVRSRREMHPGSTTAPRRSRSPRATWWRRRG